VDYQIPADLASQAPSTGYVSDNPTTAFAGFESHPVHMNDIFEHYDMSDLGITGPTDFIDLSWLGEINMGTV